MTRWRHPHTLGHLTLVLLAELAVIIWTVLR